MVIVAEEYNRHKKRMCVDYSHIINIYTELDAYPLPRIEIKIINSEQKFTAFVANGKLYVFTGIPFGVKDGVAGFQRKITQFIEEERLRDTFPYLHNVTVAGHTKEERDKNVKAW